ncbi:hypothetical protein DFH07DRAFT_765271 [Mycena maculata]|uniref:Uncharacterized protein n=1 Tax=Mycena maculata TaxID=230809 RepID=A0AAD7NYT1_9AGAR|nr:hypothetical protein DFH07DRAFT_765271 [Mycena maculata]
MGESAVEAAARLTVMRQDRMKLRGEVLTALWLAVDDEEREECDKIARAEKVVPEKAKAKERSVGAASEEPTPEERQAQFRSIDETSDVFGRVNQVYGEKTGWRGICIWGGPNPRMNGSLSMKTVCYGTSAAGNTFEQAHATFQESVSILFQKWLRRCFPADVRQSRGLTVPEVQSEEEEPLEVEEEQESHSGGRVPTSKAKRRAKRTVKPAAARRRAQATNSTAVRSSLTSFFSATPAPDATEPSTSFFAAAAAPDATEALSSSSAATPAPEATQSVNPTAWPSAPAITSDEDDTNFDCFGGGPSDDTAGNNSFRRSPSPITTRSGYGASSQPGFSQWPQGMPAPPSPGRVTAQAHANASGGGPSFAFPLDPALTGGLLPHFMASPPPFPALPYPPPAPRGFSPPPSLSLSRMESLASSSRRLSSLFGSFKSNYAAPLLRMPSPTPPLSPASTRPVMATAVSAVAISTSPLTTAVSTALTLAERVEARGTSAVLSTHTSIVVVPGATLSSMSTAAYTVPPLSLVAAATGTSPGSAGNASVDIRTSTAVVPGTTLLSIPQSRPMANIPKVLLPQNGKAAAAGTAGGRGAVASGRGVARGRGRVRGGAAGGRGVQTTAADDTPTQVAAKRPGRPKKPAAQIVETPVPEEQMPAPPAKRAVGRLKTVTSSESPTAPTPPAAGPMFSITNNNREGARRAAEQERRRVEREAEAVDAARGFSLSANPDGPSPIVTLRPARVRVAPVLAEGSAAAPWKKKMSRLEQQQLKAENLLLEKAGVKRPAEEATTGSKRKGQGSGTAAKGAKRYAAQGIDGDAFWRYTSAAQPAWATIQLLSGLGNPRLPDLLLNQPSRASFYWYLLFVLFRSYRLLASGSFISSVLVVNQSSFCGL